MNQKFVLLEILDEDICAFLNQLREIFQGRPSKSSIHVTLRGPYINDPTEREIADWEQKLRHDVILISGVGRFHNDDLHVVYLKVCTNSETRNLSRITRKFDYPKNKFQFNPHITLYSGDDGLLAERIFHFLKKEQIELVCHLFKLSLHRSGSQLDLFQTDSRPVSRTFDTLFARGRISPEVLVRARSVLSDK